jgi:hypothetical protein
MTVNQTIRKITQISNTISKLEKEKKTLTEGLCNQMMWDMSTEESEKWYKTKKKLEENRERKKNDSTK